MKVFACCLVVAACAQLAQLLQPKIWAECQCPTSLSSYTSQTAHYRDADSDEDGAGLWCYCTRAYGSGCGDSADSGSGYADSHSSAKSSGTGIGTFFMRMADNLAWLISKVLADRLITLVECLMALAATLVMSTCAWRRCRRVAMNQPESPRSLLAARYPSLSFEWIGDVLWIAGERPRQWFLPATGIPRHRRWTTPTLDISNLEQQEVVPVPRRHQHIQLVDAANYDHDADPHSPRRTRLGDALLGSIDGSQ